MKRWRISLSLIMVLFVATACFQGSVDDTSSQQSSQLVTTVPPSNTPIPDTPTSTATPIEADAQDVNIADDATSTPTNTATPTETETPTATNTPFEVAQAGDGQPDGTINTFELTATQLIIDATLTVVFPFTQTAEALTQQAPQVQPTFTPTTPAAIVTTDTGTVQQPIVSGADCVHEVARGQTLFMLSQYYGISVNDIATRNGITNINLISTGARLTIPGCGTTGALPPPTSTPTSTATQFVLPGTTNLGTGGPGTTTDNTAGTTNTLVCATQYTVQQYDTLFRISLTYGVSVQSIANANGILDTSRIDMGDVLCIPSA